MNIKDKKQLREKIRKFVVEISGGCEIQGEDKQLWPCGTCLNHILGELVDKHKPEYNERNEPPDRINEVWRFILQMRDEVYQKEK